jgi:hypothetical protein
MQSLHAVAGAESNEMLISQPIKRPASIPLGDSERLDDGR